MKRPINYGIAIRYGALRNFVAVMVLMGHFATRHASAQPTVLMCTTNNGDHYTITVTFPGGSPCGSGNITGYTVAIDLCPDDGGGCGALYTEGPEEAHSISAHTTNVTVSLSDAVAHHLYIHGQTGDSCACNGCDLQTFGYTQAIGDCNYGGPLKDPCPTGQATTQASTQSSGQQSEDDNQNMDEEDPVNLAGGATFFEAPDMQPARL